MTDTPGTKRSVPSPARAARSVTADAQPNAPLVFIRRAAQGKPENIRHRDGYCPFCDVDSLENVIRRDGDRIWLVNKFRTLADTLQTIVIESARHDGDPMNYTREENRKVFRFALSCWQEMLSSGKYRSVLMYKNYGPLSGGSLLHPHLQIVGLKHKDGYERVSPNAFDGVTVRQDGACCVTISTHPVMGFEEFNVSVPAAGGELGCGGEHADWLADACAETIRYVIEQHHGGRCTSYNLFFYHLGTDVAAPGDARIVVKVVPRWPTSPYFVGYRISQVDGPESMAQSRAERKIRYRSGGAVCASVALWPSSPSTRRHMRSHSSARFTIDVPPVSALRRL